MAASAIARIKCELKVLPANGRKKAEGPVCIGHVISDTRSLDVINAETGPEIYPPSMPLHFGVVHDINWKSMSGDDTNASVNVNVPLAAMAGLHTGLNASTAFKNSMARCGEFERLETWTVNITQSYIDDTMDSGEVKRFIKGHKRSFVVTPSLYIITGVMIGRKGKLSIAVEGHRRVGAKTKTMGDFGPGGHADLADNHSSSISHRVEDAVFAIRVVKVTKGLLDKDWSWHTLADGATFASGDDDAERINAMRAQLEANGHETWDWVELDAEKREVFVL